MRDQTGLRSPNKTYCELARGKEISLVQEVLFAALRIFVAKGVSQPEGSHSSQCKPRHPEELKSEVQLPEDQQGQKHQGTELQKKSK